MSAPRPDPRRSRASDVPAERAARARGRRRAVGAEALDGRGVDFRVWAPKRARVEVVVEDEGRALELAAEPDGYFSGLLADLAPGALYRLRLDGGPELYPDPASRFQPRGPHGPSEVIDPRGFAWTDGGWRGIGLAGQVVYEVHPGTFSPEGTWAGARAKLAHLAELGITTIELMPVAEFAGEFGWGYDGVDLFAPYHPYGRPDELRAFVDAAHALGLGVILDVVYNHFGPDGNHLRAFSDDYVSPRPTEWGDGIWFDGERSGPVREFVLENVAYWIEDFHLDGLRIDATQALADTSPEHVVTAIARVARAAAGDRSIVIVAENEPQDTRHVRPVEEGGYGLDALWNDDFHHSAVVALTGRREAYYSDYSGAPQELVSCAKHGYLYQGQAFPWQRQRRGTSARGIAPAAFVAYLENHDQVANSACGERLWRRTSPGRMRALTALLLLGAWTPMLFQGEEWSSSRPFLYFADHTPELAAQVARGRREFLRQFPSCASPAVIATLADPASRATFEGSRLDWSELESEPRARAALALHRDLLALRRDDPVLRAQAGTLDGAVLARECFVLRFLAPDASGADDRLFVVNLGPDLDLPAIPEPLVAVARGRAWRAAWSSEDPRYGGSGVSVVEDPRTGWRIPGHAATLLAAGDEERDGDAA